MERDSRRDRGQWRGCHTFKGIICDGHEGSTGRRDGGLKMGQTYYYYYELDGATETHDTTMPSTTACPYLPGQPVNTMWVPVEKTLRKRSASLSSMNHDDFQVMDPDMKFLSPRPAPSPPTTPAFRYVDSAPGLAKQKSSRSARSVSPGPRWTSLPRKLFRKASSSSLRSVRTPTLDDETFEEPPRSVPSHDLTTETLRKFLAEESGVQEAGPERPRLIIPEEIVEEIEDDENFATSAVSEAAPLTLLSPPPSQRSYSPSPTIVAPMYAPPAVPGPEHDECQQPKSHFSVDSSCYSIPQSPDSTTPPPFYHSDDEDEDSARDVSDSFPSPPMNCTEPDAQFSGSVGGPFTHSLGAALSTYSLPRSSGDDTSKTSARNTMSTPAVVARNSTDLPVDNTSLLTSSISDGGLDDLVNELSWMGKFI